MEWKNTCIPWNILLILAPEKLVDTLVGRLAAVVTAAVDEARSTHSVHHAVGVLQTRKREAEKKKHKKARKKRIF